MRDITTDVGPDVMTPDLVWHATSVETVLRLFGTSSSGLSLHDAAHRLHTFGPNELEDVRPPSPWGTLAAQFKNVLIGILLIATVVSGLIGHALEAAAIAVIVLFAVVLGFIQEFQAERALEALKQMAAPLAHVIRDGVERAVPSREVVPGDLLVLRAGDRVPADGRITFATNLAIDESALTGESVPVAKHPAALDRSDAPLAERHNMAFAGTLVTSGRGTGVAVATAMGTEFGRISALVQEVESGRTPLQQNLDTIGRALGLAALAVVALIVVLGLLRGLPPLEMVIFGIALAVAVVPEALPAVVTIALAVGVRRMVKRQALVRRLPVVETLGSTSVICSDKTGTLTKNEMTVRRVSVAGRLLSVTGAGYEPVGEFLDGNRVTIPDPILLELLRAGVLASDARLRLHDGRWLIDGDTTEGALLVVAAKAALDRTALAEQFPRVSEIPFSSERRRMTTLHAGSGVPVAYSKGAADVILDRCSHWMVDGGEAPLTPSARHAVELAEQEMAGDGLRVLALARKFTESIDEAESGMTLLGLLGMMDPPRPEARVAVGTCRDAGIRPVMITGDHPATAASIARELDVLTTGRVVSGPELVQMTDDELSDQAPEITVYARVSPLDKLRVISAWQKRGHVVAMTGDGVNDAPALKKADVGIAMGVNGTDVSREAASITLLDDNFASIVAAVEEGRIVFANIRKFLVYLLSSNLGEILLMAGTTLAGLPLPLTAVQVLYVNLASDGLPALALAVDPPDDDLMQQKPRTRGTGIFTPPVVALMLTGGIWSGLANITLFSWLLHSGRAPEHAMAMTFVSLVMIQFFKAYNFRLEHRSVFHHPFANRWLNLAVAWELSLLAALLYIPSLHAPFTTFSFSAADCVLVVTSAATVVPVIELVKWLERRQVSSGLHRDE